MVNMCSSSPPRKRQEVQEVMKETEWKVTREREEDWWRLEPDGETATPETTVLWNEVEGATVNPEGEAHHGKGASQKF